MIAKGPVPSAPPPPSPIPQDSGTRQLLPSAYLHGLLPARILEAYTLWQSVEDRLQITGQPKDVEGKHVQLPELTIRLHEDDAASTRIPWHAGVAAEVSREVEGRTQYLVNLLNPTPDTSLHKVAVALLNVEDLSKILVWAEVGPAGDLCVAAVEVPPPSSSCPPPPPSPIVLRERGWGKSPASARALEARLW